MGTTCSCCCKPNEECTCWEPKKEFPSTEERNLEERLRDMEQELANLTRRVAKIEHWDLDY